MLKARPRREDFITVVGNITTYHEEKLTQAERDYYRDALAAAVEALEKSAKSLARTINDDIDTVDATLKQIEEALSTIKGSSND